MRDWVELVRAPALLSVVGDTVAGACAAGRPLRGRRLALPLSSAFLYAAGMVLNDWADRDLDAVERPERPIPSGRVAPRTALLAAAGATAAGVAVAALAGGRAALAVAAPLAGCVWAYDTILKTGPAGPLAMAACRGLDVLMGAGSGGVRRALPAALGVAAHTAGVTTLSRGEVHGAGPASGAAALAGTTAAGAAVLAVGARSPRIPGAPARGSGRALVAPAAVAAYAAAVAPAQARALRDGTAASVRRATGAGVAGTASLTGAVAAAAGSPVTGAAAAALVPVGRRLARGVSAT